MAHRPLTAAWLQPATLRVLPPGADARQRIDDAATRQLYLWVIGKGEAGH